MEKELSIFIDESGDLGDYQNHSPFYIISLIFHEQSKSITGEIKKLNDFLEENNLPNHTIHTAPLIRQEQIYKNIVKSSHKNDIIKLGLPFGIIILGVTLYLLKKKGMKEND